MKAILLKAHGGVENFYIGAFPTPTIGDDEILVKVEATALNRADTLQRKGKYPPPQGESPILGLEMAGVVVKKGKNTKWNIGNRVCALLAGGGYAEYVSIHQDLVMPIPDNWSFEQAAATPEVFLTAFQAIRWLTNLQKDETILVHAGASGVGTAAIQLAKLIGAKVIITASPQKHALCQSLGADLCIDYKTQDFERLSKQFTKGKGVDVVLDFIGAPYLQKNINLMAKDGRMVVLAAMGGVKLESFNMVRILINRLKIMGSTLRTRSLDYKKDLITDFSTFTTASFKNGTLKPIIDSVYDWTEVATAHQYMETNKNQGKIILKVN